MTGLAQGQTYSFTIKAYDAVNNISVAGNTASVTVPPAPDTTAPSIPANVTASYMSNQILINWTASTDNVGVTLYKIINNSVQIGTSTTNSYAINSPTPGATYSLATQACDAAANCSWWSGAATVTVPTLADTIAGSL